MSNWFAANLVLKCSTHVLSDVEGPTPHQPCAHVKTLGGNCSCSCKILQELHNVKIIFLKGSSGAKNIIICSTDLPNIQLYFTCVHVQVLDVCQIPAVSVVAFSQTDMQQGGLKERQCNATADHVARPAD